MLPWKKWFQSKSIWFGLLTLTISILSFVNSEQWVQKYPEFVAVVGTIIGVLTIVLRFLTTKPMSATMEIQDIGVKTWLKHKKVN